MIGLAAGWLVLWALYLAILDSLKPGDLILGAAVAAGVLAGCRRFLTVTRTEDAGLPAARVHPTALPALGVATVVDITRGTLDVARVVLDPAPAACPGIVELPLPRASAAGLATLALTMTLSPGSVLVGVDWQRRTLLVHVVDARHPDQVRARLLDFDRRWRRPAVE